ncbi:MAG: PIG-L family deacetylase [Thermodesulfobacteriota bacterium]
MSQAVAAGHGAPVRLLAISPHCDDAVLACGDVLADHPGALVVTVFAGGPERYGEPSDWDRRAGFGPGEDVMAARRAEDRAALGVLGARPLWLGFRDSQYGRSPSVEEVASALAAIVAYAHPEAVLFPLGLFHSDHALAHEAALRVRATHGRGRTWLAYEDALYRSVPRLRDERLAALRAAGVRATPLGLGTTPASVLKRRAVARYASQLRALATPGRPGIAGAYEPERYWLVEQERQDSRVRRRTSIP